MRGISRGSWPMLPYPAVSGTNLRNRYDYGVAMGRERLAIATINISEEHGFTQELADILVTEIRHIGPKIASGSDVKGFQGLSSL